MIMIYCVYKSKFSVLCLMHTFCIYTEYCIPTHYSYIVCVCIQKLTFSFGDIAQIYVTIQTPNLKEHNHIIHNTSFIRDRYFPN